jgi:methionyl-tRNA synthetase
MKKDNKILVTAALPYANGEIHIGHLVEYLQADFWCRFQRMLGNDCKYFCADDTHGTPIMVSARNQGITPEELIAKHKEHHVRDFEEFQIEFANYSSTHSPINQELAEGIFEKMKENGHINVQTIKQAYCEHDKMFLPDRFVVGTCPKCKSPDQYGDSCDVCSATYSPVDMTDAKCKICGNTPVEKDSEHLFFKLDNFREFLKEWVPKHTQKEVSNKLNEWLQDELREWDISRDEPYFGFEIPGHPGKYFYVWLDAPVGYITSCKDWCDRNGLNFEDYWKNPDSEIYHFIGKDIVYFHCLFWPAMLKNAGYNTPSSVFVHGYLTVDGVKMSKSKGTFVMARTYLDHLDPTYMRFYYACKFSGNTDDVDLNLTDFVSRVNSDLIGKITNLASRGAQMLNKKIDGKLGRVGGEAEKALIKSAQNRSQRVAEHFVNRDFNKGMIEIREIAEDGNKYFDEKEPWKLIKEDPEKTREILTTTLNLFRIMAVYLKPILPEYVSKVEKLFGEDEYSWDSAQEVLEDKAISAYEHLIGRVDPKNVEAMVEASKK